MICLNCGNNLRLILEKKSYRYYKPCSNCFSDIIAQRPNLIIQEKIHDERRTIHKKKDKAAKSKML